MLDKREFTDPGARDIVKDNADAFKGVKTVEDFKKVLDDVLSKESAYFAAEGVEVKNVNEGFGIRNLRRKAFVESLHNQAIGMTDLSGADSTKAKGLIEGASIELVTGVDFDMKVGSHTNYWPYWDNYAPPLEKMLEQTEEGSDAYFQIKIASGIFIDARRTRTVGAVRSMSEISSPVLKWLWFITRNTQRKVGIVCRSSMVVHRSLRSMNCSV